MPGSVSLGVNFRLGVTVCHRDGPTLRSGLPLAEPKADFMEISSVLLKVYEFP
jgi:hypothetical protein